MATKLKTYSMSWSNEYSVSGGRLYDTTALPCQNGTGGKRLQKPSATPRRDVGTPLRSHLCVARVGYLGRLESSQCFRDLLRDQVIAELLLIVHHAKVVVVACAEHAVGHHLIVASPALDYPEGSVAGLEMVAGDVSSFDYS